MRCVVHFNGAPIGELTSERDRLQFTYAAAVVEAGGPVLSVRLPARAEPYGHEDAGPWFANLLPEDEYRVLLSRVLGLSDRNVAGLLGAVAGECAGAVSIWPIGQSPPTTPEYVPMSHEDMHRLFETASAAERLNLVRENRLSLAGGMEKLGLRRFRDAWYRGRAGAPTTHILKWPQSRFPDQCFNELFCLTLLRKAGLEVPSTHVEGETTAVLVIERYDRHVAEDGSISLTHQEDFCQASGLGPEHKYQGEGESGPGLAECGRVIRDYCAVPALDMARLLRWAIANYLVGNGDGHAKNLSLLHAAEGVRVAPIYDVASTLAYSGLSRKLAMSIGGEYRFQYVGTRHWERLAADVGLTIAPLRREAIGLAERLERELPGVRGELTREYGSQPVFATVVDVVEAQIARLREQLGSVAGSRRKGG